MSCHIHVFIFTWRYMKLGKIKKGKNWNLEVHESVMADLNRISSFSSPMSSCFVPDPRFVAVHLIPESDNPEDDKIYLFFKENAIDGEHAGKATHARIGQLCKVEFSSHRCSHSSLRTLTHSPTDNWNGPDAKSLPWLKKRNPWRMSERLSWRLLSPIIPACRRAALFGLVRHRWRKPERNVKCHQNLRGHDAPNARLRLLA